LKIIKADESLENIPVVVLTMSSEEANAIESFKLGVAGYIIKPLEYKKLVDAIGRIAFNQALSELRDGS